MQTLTMKKTQLYWVSNTNVNLRAKTMLILGVVALQGSDVIVVHVLLQHTTDSV